MSGIGTVFLIIVVACAGLWALLLVAIFVTHLVEKRPARYLTPALRDDPEWAKLGSRYAGTAPASEPFNPYARPGVGDYPSDQNRAAEAQGFTCHGLFRHVKGGTYNVHVALWTSPDRQVLAVVGWGMLAKIKADKTLLYSKLDDGRFLLTADKPPGNDTPGLYEIALAQNAPLKELVARHQKRFATCGRAVVPFEGDDALASYEAILVGRQTFLVEQGDAYYLDADRSVIRSTLKGAIKPVFRAIWLPEYAREAVSPSRAAAASASGSKLLSRAEWFFGFMVVFGMYLRFRSPSVNQAQWLFRTAMVGLGVVGLAVVYILKIATRKKRT